MTCREEILRAAEQLVTQSDTGEFHLDDLIAQVQSNGTAYAEATIRTHVISRMCADAPDNHQVTHDDLERTDRGIYRLL